MKRVIVTNSGADYEISDGFWTYRGEEMGRLYTFMVTRLSGEEQIEKGIIIPLPWNDAKQEFWQHSFDKETHQYVPVIGRRMYLNGPNYWRISTPVKSMEVVA